VPHLKKHLRWGDPLKRMHHRSKIHILILLSFFLFLSGCATARHATPLELLPHVKISGLQDIRAISGEPSDTFKNDFISLLEQEEKEGFSFFDFKSVKTYSMLAISGGSANGAYGAGLLCGWTKSGSRPVFKIITGISTGAVIAPLAFMGPDYDDKLKEFYTSYSTKDIIRLRNPRIRIPFSNSIADSWPLERLLEKYFDAKFIDAVAAEYKKGRRLYIGTTNLDADRMVVWDMGKIASVGDEKSQELFRKIILASSSMPIAFPPVYFKAELANNVYDEMHVDGGLIHQVFFLHDVLKGFDKAIKEKGIDTRRIKFQIYVIRNGYVDPVYKEVPDKMIPIAERTVDAITNSQSVGDLYQLYMFNKDGNGDFNLAYIPATHITRPKELFDRKEMIDLFNLGFKEASEGYSWRKSPPGRDAVE